MDLHLSHLSLHLTRAMLLKSAAVTGAPLYTHIYPKMLVLSRSALMQGQAQQSLIALFQALVQANVPNMTYGDLFGRLYSAAPSGAGDLSKQGLSNLSKCIAAITISSQATAQVCIL